MKVYQIQNILSKATVMRKIITVFLCLLALAFISCSEDKSTSPNNEATDETLTDVKGDVGIDNAPVSPDQLTINSFRNQSSVTQNGKFDTQVTSDNHNEVLVATYNDEPVLLGYVLPDDDDVSIDAESTALALTMMNPLLMNTTAAVRSQIAGNVKQHEDFANLVSTIAAIYVNDTANTLDYDKYPEIYTKSVTIFLDVYNAYNSSSKISATELLEDPYIEDRNENIVGYVNPSYVYYGSNTLDTGNNSSFSFLLEQREFLDFGLSWPPQIFGEPPEVERNLSDGTYIIDFYKGFVLQDGMTAADLIDFTEPFGQATLVNTLRGVANILDIVLSLPHFKIEDAVHHLEFNAADVMNFSESLASGDVKGAVTSALNLLLDNTDNILYAVWQNLTSPEQYGEQTSQLHTYLQQVGPVLKNVAVVMRVVGAVDKVPFFVDLIGSKSHIQYSITHTDGVITDTVPPPELTLTAPSNGASYDDRIVSVEGYVDDTSITTGEIFINDVLNTFIINDGQFSKDISLFSGTNSISVKVTNEKGLSDVETVNVICTEDKAAIRIQLTWDTEGTDVDLHVFDTNNHHTCYWAQNTSESATAIPGANLDLDDTDGFGPENFTFNDPANDTYTIKIHYYWDEGYGPTNAQVRIYINEQFYSMFGPINLKNEEVWEVATIKTPENTITSLGNTILPPVSELVEKISATSHEKKKR